MKFLLNDKTYWIKPYAGGRFILWSDSLMSLGIFDSEYEAQWAALAGIEEPTKEEYDNYQRDTSQSFNYRDYL